MLKLFLTSICAVMCGFAAYAQDEIIYQDFQTIYTETPVQSYYAYPDDPNFIPETEFMERADSLEYDRSSLSAFIVSSMVIFEH